VVEDAGPFGGGGMVMCAYVSLVCCCT
jgi:hypothetical protein